MQRSTSGSVSFCLVCLTAVCASVAARPMYASPLAATGQQAAASARQSGTVKEVHASDFVLTTASGDVTVAVPSTGKVMIVPPGSKSLGDATPGTMADVQAGDRALVTGTAGDSPTSFSAGRVILMKSGAIAAVHAADSAAWAQGVGGIVKSVSGQAITVSSGMKTISVATTPNTVVRRYAPGSVNFADAVTSTVAAIQPGDQLRVRGAKSADGTSVTADEIVSGNFKNYSGTIAAIDPAATTITLKDLTTKKMVTVAVSANSDLRRLPPQMATMIAARMKGGAAGGEGGAGGPGGPGGGAPATPQGAGRSAGGPGGPGGAGGPGGGGPGGGGPGGGGPGGGGRAAGADLSRMLSRLPTETLGGLKTGEAVMIVATAPTTDADKAAAITLLVGVDAILAAPRGQSTTLSPWSLGGGGEGEMGGGGGGH